MEIKNFKHDINCIFDLTEKNKKKFLLYAKIMNEKEIICPYCFCLISSENLENKNKKSEG